MLHLSTFPVPRFGKVDPQVVGQGLGDMGTYEISYTLWHQLALLDFEASFAEFSLPRDGYSPSREDMVLPIVCRLFNAGVVSLIDRGCPVRRTC